MSFIEFRTGLKTTAVGAALLGAFAVGGCDGHLGSGPPPPVAYACPAPAVLGGPALLYPAPNATGVSPSVGEIVLGGPFPSNAGTSGPVIDVDRPDGTVIVRATLGPAPSPLPSIAATPAPPGSAPAAPSYTSTPLGFAIPVLPANTTITIQEESLVEDRCAIPVGASGSFTTGT